MMFRFTLQKVLELRAAHEQKTAVERGAAQARADEARREKNGLTDVLAARMAELHRDGGTSRRVGDLQHQSMAVAQLQARVARADEQLSVAESQMRDSDQVWQAAVRDRHMLDRLKARHGALWRLAAARGELSEMDAVALSRFGIDQAGKES